MRHKPTLSYDEMLEVETAIEKIYPDCYAYTQNINDERKRLLIFRSRDESFDPENAVVILYYLNTIGDGHGI